MKPFLTSVALTLLILGTAFLAGCAEPRAVCEVQGPEGLTYVPCTGTVFYE